MGGFAALAAIAAVSRKVIRFDRDIHYLYIVFQEQTCDQETAPFTEIKHSAPFAACQNREE